MYVSGIIITFSASGSDASKFGTDAQEQAACPNSGSKLTAKTRYFF